MSARRICAGVPLPMCTLGSGTHTFFGAGCCFLGVWDESFFWGGGIRRGPSLGPRQSVVTVHIRVDWCNAELSVCEALALEHHRAALQQREPPGVYVECLRWRLAVCAFPEYAASLRQSQSFQVVAVAEMRRKPPLIRVNSAHKNEAHPGFSWVSSGGRGPSGSRPRDARPKGLALTGEHRP